MEQKHTLEELRGHLAEVKTGIKELNEEFDGLDFPPDTEAKFEALKEERAKTEAAIAKREERLAYVETLEGRDGNRETEPTPTYSFQTRKRTNVPDNPLDLDEYRTRNNSLDGVNQAYRDGAKLVMERHFNPTHPAASKEQMQDDVEKLIDLDNEVALRMIATSSRGYAKEFETYVRTQGRVVGKEMERAASLTTTAGGFAVPVDLDTTLMITNAGAISPIRAVARVRQTNANTVEFINTTGITAGFGAEATEASDNAPTLAQPTINLEKAFAFVPGSIEIFEDWQNIQADLAMAFADAKSRLESTKFLTGVGHGSNEPQGLIAVGGATAVVTSGTTATMAVTDLYNLEQGLSPRYRANAHFFGNKAAYNKIRAFDTAGGGALWVQLQYGQPGQLMGYPAHEWSDYTSATTTTGSTVLTFGDPSYFAIADRVGLNVEYIQHLFATANNRPSGQRGLYAYWRTSSQLLSPTLQSNSAFVSLKLL